MPDTGNGATLTRSGLTVDIVSIQLSSQSIGTIDTSLLATTGFMQKIAEDLADAGTVTVEYNFDAEESGDFQATGGAAVSTTITLPITNSGNTTNATIIGTAILTDFQPPSFANNELQRASVTLTWDGVTGPTFSAEAA